MRSAADYLAKFNEAMTPEPGTISVPAHRVDQAQAFALAALAAAVIETATYPDPATLTTALSQTA